MAVKFKKITSSFLPRGFKTDGKEGLCARFYPDGSLRHYGWYVDGKCDTHMFLELENGRPEGKVIYPDCVGFDEYKNGINTLRTNFSKNHVPMRMRWDEWVKSWIKRISDRSFFEENFIEHIEKKAARIKNSADAYSVLEWYKKWARLMPSQGEPWMKMGHLYCYRLDDPKKAIACYERAETLGLKIDLPLEFYKEEALAKWMKK